jgi:hypothetical protein
MAKKIDGKPVVRVRDGDETHYEWDGCDWESIKQIEEAVERREWHKEATAKRRAWLLTPEGQAHTARIAEANDARRKYEDEHPIVGQCKNCSGEMREGEAHCVSFGYEESTGKYHAI